MSYFCVVKFAYLGVRISEQSRTRKICMTFVTVGIENMPQGKLCSASSLDITVLASNKDNFNILELRKGKYCTK